MISRQESETHKSWPVKLLISLRVRDQSILHKQEPAVVIVKSTANTSLPSSLFSRSFACSNANKLRRSCSHELQEGKP